MKKNCLIVLNPREIDVCMSSIRSLDIDKVYFRAFDEPNLCGPINTFIRKYDYDNYLVISDDVIVTNHALSLVVGLLEYHEAATGYCLVSQEDDFVNITRSPLVRRQGFLYGPTLEDYEFYYKREVELFKNPIFVSWFGGWCLTGFSKKAWLSNRFVVMPSGRQSDYATCLEYGKRIYCHRDAYVEHLKKGILEPNHDNFLVGVEEPEIIYEVDGRITRLETPAYCKVGIKMV